VNCHRIERGKNLRRELSRGRYDQRASLPAWLGDEMMKNRQHERGGLAASRHRARENVAPFQCCWYCLGLNWSWSLKAQFLEALMETGMKL
jgi:hypothetical protein